MTPQERTEKLRRVGHSTELKNLDEDVCAEVARYLLHYRAQRDQLSAKSVDELLMMYMNWRLRQIYPRPRNIYISRELLSNPLRSQYLDNFEKLVEKIRTGDNLMDLLSDRIKQNPYTLEYGVTKLTRKKARIYF